MENKKIIQYLLTIKKLESSIIGIALASRVLLCGLTGQALIAAIALFMPIALFILYVFLGACIFSVIIKRIKGFKVTYINRIQK